MRFSVIEIKAVLYTLITNFVFAPTEDKVFKANVYALLSSYLLRRANLCSSPAS